ncbi:MAG: sugar kinase, partial [Ignavibacteriales bacterium]|nr:sugar kinase [Ignavibacteriales bacterium]
IIPDGFKKSAYVCLGNIDPVLQLQVVERVNKPRLIVGDTMNYWIESKPKELSATLKAMDMIILNESEARLLTNEPNLIKAAKKIIEMGPKIIIIKKGEHGALLVTLETIFSAPAYPLENIYDPTGAGDSFAGGLIGWLARTDDLSGENLKRAVIYGSTLASFCVEKFSVDGLKDLTYLQIQDRYRSFMQLSRFDER